MDSVKTGERARTWVEPASAEIDIGTTLFPWYGEWLWRHTEPGKLLTKRNAIHAASMDARGTLGYGSHQTLRGYLETYCNPMSGRFREKSDPGTGLKWIERNPKVESLEEVLTTQLYQTGRKEFVRELEKS